MRYAIGLMLFIKLTSAIAQTDHDSLYQLWQSAESIEDKAHALDRLFSNTFYSDRDTSLFYINQTLELGESEDIDSIRGLAYKNMASYFIAQGRYREMDSSMNLVAQYYDTSSVSDISIQYFLYKGHYQYLNSEYELAPTNYLKVYGIATQLQDTISLSSALTSLGNCLKATNNHEKAVGYFEEANELMLAKGKEQRDRTNVCVNLGTSYALLGQDEKAEYYFLEAIELAEEFSMKHITSLASRNLATFYLKRDQSKKARNYADDALQIAQDEGYPREEATTLQVLGDIYQADDRHSNAITSYKKALALMEENDFSLKKEELLQRLANSYEEIDDLGNSLAIIKEYYQLKDSIYELNKIEQLESLEEQFQSAKKDIELANQKAEIHQRTSQRNLAYVGGLGLLSLGAFLFYRSRKNHKLASTRIENLEKHQKLMALDYMVQGQEVERKRIAQDLHDGLGGLLSTARMQIQNVQNEINKLGEMNLLNDTEALINNACNEVRRISHDMMPGALIDLGLVDAVEDLSANIMDEHPIQITIEDSTSDITLDDNYKVQLYRICQELLNNTIKHAGASKVRIQFIKEGEYLKLNYKDDGKGFDVKAINENENPGLGLKNIKSRVKYLNGKLSIDSDEGEGVLFAIRVSLDG